MDECRRSILFTAKNMENDITSTFINTNRIQTMRILIDLFEKYNNILIEKESDGFIEDFIVKNKDE
jgi:hypothetical protein